MQPIESDELLAEVCQAPGCYLLNGDHWPGEVTACVERWLVEAADREVQG